MKNNIEPSEWTLKEWHDNPKNWRLGVFYLNPNDKRVFLPKRFYGGLTLNFANPFSIVAMILIVLAMILLTWIV